MRATLVCDHALLITAPGLVQAFHDVDPGVVEQKDPLNQVCYRIALDTGHVDDHIGDGHGLHHGIYIHARPGGIAVGHVPQHHIGREHGRGA